MSEEQSKFTGVLAQLNKRPIEEQQASPENRSRVSEPLRGRGRPPGKRSDPDYQPTTVLLRKQTKKTAVRLLEDTNAGSDLSELIEQLLMEWIHQQM